MRCQLETHCSIIPHNKLKINVHNLQIIIIYKSIAIIHYYSTRNDSFTYTKKCCHVALCKTDFIAQDNIDCWTRNAKMLNLWMGGGQTETKFRVSKFQGDKSEIQNV